ncbi:hypothetical protein CB0940_12140 [Cercospora beticola]|uniref:Clr5 domain-containing protein n=1 Tax=Cercospora beticola TaxID=122368 RepID=A0A2G5GJ58_CERBT|nr:hypothetical protein CB0940_12140 [Cercospora beticola]PIA80023.1 hypothetical protein CB0940_12140 [Cercospora beticola]WPB07638.1 hypothetical protein RHO25_012299 [Cercospora beticola]CAK1356560.1 unnamed protein product [Cercospora beticola]
MPRPPAPLDDHKDFIIDSIDVLGLTQAEVCAELRDSHDLNIGRSTLVKALARWGFRTRRVNFEDTPALRMRLQNYFHQTTKTDAEIAALLTADGMDVTCVRVRKLRKDMGLYKRVDADRRDVAENTVEELLKLEFQNEEIRNMGHKQLYRYMRKKYNVAGRDRMFVIAKKLDPEGPDRRLRAQRRAARRSGLEKERAAKENQTQQSPETANAVSVEQQPLPGYVPLDPAMYQSEYASQRGQHGSDAPAHYPSHGGFSQNGRLTVPVTEANAPTQSSYAPMHNSTGLAFDSSRVPPF